MNQDNENGLSQLSSDQPPENNPNNLVAELANKVNDTLGRVESLATTVKSQTQESSFLKYIMVGVVLVLAVAFGGMLVGYESQQQTSYEDLKDQVLLQNQKIDDLTKQVTIFTQEVQSSSKSIPQ